MVAWDAFKKAYTKFLGCTDQSTVLSMAGVTCIRSGINHPSFNFFIVDNYISDIQKQLFAETFDCNGVVASFSESHSFINQWSPRLKFLGRPYLMSALPHNINLIEVDPDIEVRDASDKGILLDHIAIIEEVRGMRGYGKILSKVEDPMHIYVAYVNGIPAGTGSAIQFDNSVFILDTVTREAYQNTRVLSTIANVSVQNAKSAGISSFAAMVTSGHSQRVAEQLGFRVEQAFDYWKHKVN